jgi:hypothetical protein
MTIPTTTKDKPFIKFLIDEKGKLSISPEPTSTFWGGIHHSFIGPDGEGNTCKPEDLPKYLEAFKRKKKKRIEKEILKLQKEIKTLSKLKLHL